MYCVECDMCDFMFESNLAEVRNQEAAKHKRNHPSHRLDEWREDDYSITI